MIQAVLKNVSMDLTPLRNRELDRQRLAERLSVVQNCDNANKRRRDNVQFQSQHPTTIAFYRMDKHENINKCM
ncbi:unnamed protein product [Acanthoscelides obtectus]|uniref:Uncharacterized protein n=1 Tax=Acanthoscelides obtectus TaxID=200917 RepID=A0A9P0Q9C5_ACAOB|nr:unnamed protein product [Acanthoscelides obtectus]CAK1642265.1 hypothetical protein AOBTE_LOCUS12933 [Acanthoscelides obtectus]